MRDPIRMIESGELSAFELDLLESARREEPNERARGILIAGLGGAGILPFSAESLAPSPSLAAPSWSKVALVRWISGVGIGGAVAVGWLATHPTVETPSSCADGARCGAPSVSVAAPRESVPRIEAVERSPVQASREVASESAPDLRSAPSTPSRSVPVRSGQGAGAVLASRSLTEEVAALEPARVALRAGDASLALQVLARYQGRFPSGVLRPEAEALRIQARALSAPDPGARRAEAKTSPGGVLKSR